jgi:succinate-semialdehyde dehydrogenase/glutarate-semialdehyde dehydrogenase
MIDGRLFIGGERVEGSAKLVSKCPATLEAIGEVSLASTAQCAQAVDAAGAAFPAWRDLPVGEKKRIFKSAEQALYDRRVEAARLVSLEKGSPYAESLAVEVLGSLAILDLYARRLDRMSRPKSGVPSLPLFAHKRSTYHFQPLGANLVISPWNFPFLIPFSDVVSTLSAGNTVVLRPSTATPLVALLLGEIFAAAGIPPGVLNVVNCRTGQAEEMISNPKVQTVMFTGSVGIGKRVMELASRNLTNVVLELGGKDPMIVLADADVERAARGAVWAAFMNCGQSCASVERVYVAREIAPAFTARVVDLTKTMKVGHPLEPGTDMGPMTTLGQLETVLEHVRDARERGARILTGGGRVEGLPGYYHAPTVLDGVDHSMKIMTEETFGPTLPIMAVADAEEAVRLANDCRYGLTASVWTRSRRAAAAVAERLQAGSVTINDHMFSFTEPNAIWGGIKETGMGRSHGPFGLLYLQNIKFVSADFSTKKSWLWWFPYDTEKPALLEKAMGLLFASRIGARAKALAGLVPSLRMMLRGLSFRALLKSSARLFRK